MGNQGGGVGSQESGGGEEEAGITANPPQKNDKSATKKCFHPKKLQISTLL